MVKKILKNPQAVVGLILIVLVVFAALAAPVLAPNSPELVDTTKKYMAPCAEYPLGTDQLGRCELSRLIYGARYSLGISCLFGCAGCSRIGIGYLQRLCR